MSIFKSVVGKVNDVYVSDNSYGGIYFYTVMVNGKPYDTFDLRMPPPLTHSQLVDVARYYEEALAGL